MRTIKLLLVVFSVCLGAACGVDLPDSQAIPTWVLKPAASPLTGVRSLSLTGEPAGAGAAIKRQLRDDLIDTERFAIAGQAAAARLDVVVERFHSDEVFKYEVLVQDSNVRRYSRTVTQTVHSRGDVTGADGTKLATVRTQQKVEQPCGVAVVTSDLPLDNDVQVALFPPVDQSCDTSVVLARSGRALAQSLVPHFELRHMQLYTEGLPNASHAAERAVVGDWEAAEALARADEEHARTLPKPPAGLNDKAAYNLAVVLTARGEPERASAQLGKASRLKGSTPYQSVLDSTGEAQLAQTQAALDHYEPHRLPSL